MSDKDKVLEITSRFISELSAQKPSNLMMAVKTHYDLWQSELIVLLRERNIGVNEFLAMLLRESGYENASAELVRSYMSRVGKTKQSASKAHPLPALAITTPLDTSRPPAAAVGSVGGQRGVTAPVVAHKPMAVSVAPAVASTSVVYDLDEFPFKEHTDRLNAEVLAFYDKKGMAWSESDDELLAVFTQLSQSRFTPLVKLTQAFGSNENLKQSCFGAFKIKCKELGVDLTPHGFQ